MPQQETQQAEPVEGMIWMYHPCFPDLLALFSRILNI